MLDRIRGKSVLVVGLARSGVAAVRLLSRLGAKKIIINDKKEEHFLKEELDSLKGIDGLNIICGDNLPSLVTEDISLLVKSPGIPPHLEIFKKAKKIGIPIISEVELAYHFIKAPIVGITGTNGKTTTTSLISELLREAGMGKVISAGNIGNPLCGIVEEAVPGSVVVAELSSFQLEDTVNFRPAVSVILNITSDHLDYHGDMESYISAKKKILVNQNRSDLTVINADDPIVKGFAKETGGGVVLFSRLKEVKEGFCIYEGAIVFKRGNFTQTICPVDQLYLPGEHNLENVLAGVAAAWACGADLKTASKVLRKFKGVEHRLELVREVEGVVYVNDSKATNVESSLKALDAFKECKILIAGGMDKKADFTALARRIVVGDVKGVVLLGETAPLIKTALESEGYESAIIVKQLTEAVKTAYKQASGGEVVLLSPACASWDMFTDYEERGQIFKEAVALL